jgi:hypothetical protein
MLRWSSMTTVVAWTSAVALLAITACTPGPSKPAGEAGPASTATSTEAPSESPGESPGEPAQGGGAKLCLPVAACNMFVGCALVEEEKDPDHPEASRYRVLAYEHHPDRVGSHFGRGEVCWPSQAKTPKGCADALLYENVPCTPVPPEQMALSYSCAPDACAK